MSKASLLAVELPLACRDEWQRVMDDISFLDAYGDPCRTGCSASARMGLLKAENAKLSFFLDFTRAFHRRTDRYWRIIVDQHKTD